MVQPRREVWEYGGLPLLALIPQLDGVQTLLSFHGKLLARSKTQFNGHHTVSPADVAAVLELTPNQLEVLTEVLASLSHMNSAAATAAASTMDDAPSPAPQTPALGQEHISVHELSLFLFAQLFAKEATRPDNVEYWPDPNGGMPSLGLGGPSSMGSFGMGNELLSPTRRSQSGGRTLLRQQLQAHLRSALMAARGYGDYVRRNLRPVLELVLEPSSWPPGPGAVVCGQEVDRLAFLLAPARGDPDEPLSATLGLSPRGVSTPSAASAAATSSLSLDAAASALRSSWAEELLGPGGGLESPRMLTFSASSVLSMSSPSPKFQRAMGMVAPAGQVDESAITGVYRGTVVRGEGDLPHGDARITDCHEAVIYILAPMQAVFVSGCSDCVIVVGAVGRMLRVERCDKVQVIAATNRLLISSCYDCTLNVGTPRPPTLIGDNRFVRLGPYNTRYERQAHHVREVGLRVDLPNRFDQPVVLVAKDRKALGGSSPASPRSSFGGANANLGGPGASGTASSPSPSAAAAKAAGYSLQAPEDLQPFVVPFVGGPGPLAGGSASATTTRWGAMVNSAARASAPLYLFPLPPEYERALQKRLNMTHELRNKFKQASLPKDKERELNDAIQGYFKEWLVGTNLLRQIYDLSTLEKEELAAAAGAGITLGGSTGSIPGLGLGLGGAGSGAGPGGPAAAAGGAAPAQGQ